MSCKITYQDKTFDTAEDLFHYARQHNVRAILDVMNHPLPDREHNAPSRPSGGDMYLQAQTLNERNEQFNKDLGEVIKKTLKPGTTLNLGKPGRILQQSGLENLPINITSTLLVDKSTQANHKFNLEDLINLPRKLNFPVLMVMDPDNAHSVTVMVDMKDSQGRYFTVAVGLQNKGDHYDITTIFPRDNDAKIFRLVNDGQAMYINKEKSLKYLQSRGHNALSHSSSTRDFYSKVTDKINTFRNRVSEDDVQEWKRQFQLEKSTLPSKASSKTLSRIREFMARVGVDEKKVQAITIDGKPVGANGAAHLFQAVAEVVEGSEATALPEEAMHFAVEILEQTQPKLFNGMLSAIGNYALYRDIYDQYKNEYTRDGKPDLRKIKKEAMARLLVEQVIHQSEGLTEKPELLAKSQGWWQAIKDWFKVLFNKAGFNPFHEAAKQVLDNNFSEGATKNLQSGDTYQQLGESPKQTAVWDKMQQEKVDTVKVPTLGVNGEESSKYLHKGKDVANRVTSLVKGKAGNKFKDKEVTPETRKLWNEYTKVGTRGHADMEAIGETLVNPSTGLLRETPLDDSGYTSQLNPADRAPYEVLKRYLTETLASYPEGTRFSLEQIIYDGSGKSDTGGTIDFVAILPEKDGKVEADILDWKFKYLDKQKYDDIPWYNKQEWQDQMGHYSRMLKKYGVDKIRRSRMVPVIVDYQVEGRDTLTPTATAKSITLTPTLTIGNAKYELPVPTYTERTGDASLDKLLDKLVSVLDRERGKEVIGGRKDLKAEMVNSITTSIREIQVRQNLQPLLHQAALIGEAVDRTLATADTVLAIADLSTLSREEKSTLLYDLREGKAELGVYAGLHVELLPFFKEKVSPEDEILRKGITEAAEKAQVKLSQLTQMQEALADRMATEERGIAGILNPEREMAFLNRTMDRLSDRSPAAQRALYQISSDIEGKSADEERKLLEELIHLNKGVTAWARAKGMSVKAATHLFYARDEKGKVLHKLIDETDAAFFVTLKEKIKTQDAEWMQDNIDIPAYIQAVQAYVATEKQRINENIYPGTDEAVRERKERETRELEEKYNLENGNALLQYGSHTKVGVRDFPLGDKWQSPAYKELLKKGNEPVLTQYRWQKALNDRAAESGYLDEVRSVRTFLAYVPRTLAETLANSGVAQAADKALMSFAASPDDVGYGAKDELTGKIVNKVPRYFTQDRGGDYSDDYYKSIEAFVKYATKYKYAKQYEEEALLYGAIEEAKDHLKLNTKGEVLRDASGEELQTIKGNEVNLRSYEDAMKYVIYGQKYVDSDTDANVEGLNAVGKVLRKTGNSINRLLGKDIVEENVFQDRQASMRKIVTANNSAFRLIKLGASPLLSTVNFLGGNAQAMIKAGRFYNKTEYIKHELSFKLRKFQGTEGMKYLAVIHEFMPLLEDEGRELGKKLRPSALQKHSLSELLMSMQTGGEKLIQYANAGAFLENAIIRDGKIVNAREWLRQQPDYRSRYEGSATDRAVLEASFEEKVKELQKENVFNTATLKEDHLQAPWADKAMDDARLAYRSLVRNYSKTLTGNMSAEDIRRANQDLFMASFMVFKNWIPTMVADRTKDLHYVEGLKGYEWGRMRMTARILLEHGLFSLKGLGDAISMVKGSGKGVSALDALYEAKKAEYEKQNGTPFTMDKAAFFDLVRQNIRMQMKETLLLLAMIGMYLGLKAIPPDPDEDAGTKNFYRYSLRALDKLHDEISFYYNPLSFQQILNGSVFPSLGLITDATRVLANVGEQGFGFVLQNNKLMDSAHPAKYLMKTIPVTSQLGDYLAIFYPQLAKDLNIQVSSQSRMH